MYKSTVNNYIIYQLLIFIFIILTFNDYNWLHQHIILWINQNNNTATEILTIL